MNHPIHLACVFGRSRFLTRTSPSLIPWDEVGIIVVGDNSRLSALLPPDTLPGDRTVRGTVVELAAQYSKECLMELFDHVLAMVSKEFLQKRMTSTWVSRLRKIVPVLADKGFAEDACKKLWRWSRLHRLPREALLLFCQFLCASEWQMTERCDVTCLPFSTCLQECQISTIAQFLTTQQLFAFSNILKRRVDADCDFHYEPRGCEHSVYFIHINPVPLSRMNVMLSVLEREQRERTLHQECVLALIKSVKGDVKRLQKVNMPEPLRKYFRVPFETLSEEGNDGETNS